MLDHVPYTDAPPMIHYPTDLLPSLILKTQTLRIRRRTTQQDTPDGPTCESSHLAFRTSHFTLKPL